MTGIQTERIIRGPRCFASVCYRSWRDTRTPMTVYVARRTIFRAANDRLDDHDEANASQPTMSRLENAVNARDG